MFAICNGCPALMHGLVRMRLSMRAFFAVLFLVFSSNLVSAQGFETQAPQAVLIDSDTGTVLYSKEIQKKF